tara:strand:- start:414 stop:569 length:156 start_codon:yes stop_codon:yes gene_type:complete
VVLPQKLPEISSLYLHLKLYAYSVIFGISFALLPATPKTTEHNNKGQLWPE